MTKQEQEAMLGPLRMIDDPLVTFYALGRFTAANAEGKSSVEAMHAAISAIKETCIALWAKAEQEKAS